MALYIHILYYVKYISLCIYIIYKQFTYILANFCLLFAIRRRQWKSRVYVSTKFTAPFSSFQLSCHAAAPLTVPPFSSKFRFNKLSNKSTIAEKAQTRWNAQIRRNNKVLQKNTSSRRSFLVISSRHLEEREPEILRERKLVANDSPRTFDPPSRTRTRQIRITSSMISKFRTL